MSDLLGVSEATVRRDLEELEGQGLLERTRGGAVRSQRLPHEPEYRHSELAHPEEKRWIGALAAGLIESGDIIFVNSGTTTTQVVRQIRNVSDVTVFTNNISAVEEAREAGLDLELILLGGTVRYPSNSVVGRYAAGVLSQVYANKTFLGVDGISLKHGCTMPISAEAEIGRTMIERTQGQVIVVADYSKWGVVSNFQVARIDEVSTLVTDEQLGAEALAELAARGVRALVASGLPSGADGKGAG